MNSFVTTVVKYMTILKQEWLVWESKNKRLKIFRVIHRRKGFYYDFELTKPNPLLEFGEIMTCVIALVEDVRSARKGGYELADRGLSLLEELRPGLITKLSLYLMKSKKTKERYYLDFLEARAS